MSAQGGPLIIFLSLQHIMGISSGLHSGVFDLIAQSGPMAKFVLIVLSFFSIVSWAIMADRFRTFRRVEKESHLFLHKFHHSKNISEINEFSKLFDRSPLINIFQAGLLENNPSPTFHQEEKSFRRALDKSSSSELIHLEKHLSFLGTTASATPFIGLFGTVWGIMNAFRGIGISGTASLAAYAPGIAEALITTAAGLAAAIPALIGYNYFVRKARMMDRLMEEFKEDLIVKFEEAA